MDVLFSPLSEWYGQSFVINISDLRGGAVDKMYDNKFMHKKLITTEIQGKPKSMQQKGVISKRVSQP